MRNHRPLVALAAVVMGVQILVCGGVVGVAGWFVVGKKTPVSLGMAMGPQGKLARHPYWRKKMTASDIDALVKKGQRLGAGDILVIEANGSTELLDGNEAVMRRVYLHDHRWTFDFTRDVVHIDGGNFTRRPDSDRVLRELERELDQVEHHRR